MLTEQQKAEMRTAYRGAANKHKQIKILSELNACSKAQVLEALGLAAEKDVPCADGRIKSAATRKGKPQKRHPQSLKDDVIRAVILEGVTQQEASERFCVPFQTVHDWVRKARKTQQQFLDAADTITAECAQRREERAQKAATGALYNAEGKRVPAIENPKWSTAVEAMVEQPQAKQLQVVPEFEAAAKKADCEIETHLRMRHIGTAAQALHNALNQLNQADLLKEEELSILNRVAERAKIFHAGMLYATEGGSLHEA